MMLMSPMLQLWMEVMVIIYVDHECYGNHDYAAADDADADDDTDGDTDNDFYIYAHLFRWTFSTREYAGIQWHFV